VRAAAEQIGGKFDGNVDILVNNAGIFDMAPVDETKEETFDLMIATNLAAPFRFTRAFLPIMKRNKRGHVVSIGSIADRKIFAGNSAYSASKFGLRAIHAVLREELRGSGVRSTLISPASVDTSIWEGVGGGVSKSGFLPASAVVDAVLFALRQPAEVNIEELRLAYS
jgi:NADP-dependent 3-hydroxy acid dehydrogenase YdfG